MTHNYLATGQRRCWDAAGEPIPCSGSGQDAEQTPGLAWPEPRFRTADGEVVDRLTGLVWLQNANCAGPLFWDEALHRVAQLNRAPGSSHHDWRLPNRRELRSLVSFATARPALPDRHPFVDVEPTWYWSATSAAIDRSYAWALELLGGRLFYLEKQRSALVWPCRGTSRVIPATGQRGAFDSAGKPVPLEGSGQDGDGNSSVAWPRPRFVAHQEIVRDQLTDLVWLGRTDAAPGPASWADALAAIELFNQDGAAGRTNWRLPTINELESLVDASRHDPALPQGHPFQSVEQGFWSSTSSSFEPDWAMVLHLDRGAVGVGPKTSPAFYTWPVADP